jgi:hypothetical protein
MKRNVMLTIASLLSILFMTFHLTDDRAWDGAVNAFQPYCGAHPGHLAVRKGRRLMAVYGAPALRGLDRGARALMILPYASRKVVAKSTVRHCSVGDCCRQTARLFPRTAPTQNALTLKKATFISTLVKAFALTSYDWFRNAG